MLKVTNYQKTCQVIDPIMVYVEGVTPGTKDYDIIDMAIEHVGESRGSLFGWSMTRSDDGTAVVRLNRD
jgi:hypothetical protein